jgi:hypothetical protein
MWPGDTDPDLYFMFKRNQMRYLYLADNKWKMIQKQPQTELATRRNVNLSIKIPDVPPTGIAEGDRCVYVRAINVASTTSTSNKGHFIAPRCREIIPEEISLDDYFVNLLVF